MIFLKNVTVSTTEHVTLLFYCIHSRVYLYLWGGDVEHFCDLGIQLLDISESMNPPCGTPMSQLGVEDELRSGVFWWPCWWRWRGRERRRCGLRRPLILALVLGLLLLRGLGPCCLGVLRAHSLSGLHQPQLKLGPPLGALVVHCSEREKNTVLPDRLADQPSNQPATQSFAAKKT